MQDAPTTLLEAVAFFSDPERAHSYAVALRWPTGVACPRVGCGSIAVQSIKSRRIWRCKRCRRQFSVRVGTVFEDSALPFTKWFPAVWFLANGGARPSPHALARAIAVSPKTAASMLRRLREALTEPSASRRDQALEARPSWLL